MSPSPGSDNGGRSKRQRRGKRNFSPQQPEQKRRRVVVRGSERIATRSKNTQSLAKRESMPSPVLEGKQFKRRVQHYLDPNVQIQEILGVVRKRTMNAILQNEKRIVEINRILPTFSMKKDEEPDTENFEDDPEKLARERTVLERAKKIENSRATSVRPMTRPASPPRTKSHWDYVLEEMANLFTERREDYRWKVQSSKRITKAVQKYFQEAESRENRSKRNFENQLKRRANLAGKEVKRFWKQIEQVARYIFDQEQEVEKKAQRERQLHDLLGQTEKFSSMIADDFQTLKEDELQGATLEESSGSSESEEKVDFRSTAQLFAPGSVSDASIGDSEDATKMADEEGDAEFVNVDGDGTDDEETLEKEEAIRTRAGGKDADEEIRDLAGEADLDILELLRSQGIDPESYLQDQGNYLNGNKTKSPTANKSNNRRTRRETKSASKSSPRDRRGRSEFENVGTMAEKSVRGTSSSAPLNRTGPGDEEMDKTPSVQIPRTSSNEDEAETNRSRDPELIVISDDGERGDETKPDHSTSKVEVHVKIEPEKVNDSELEGLASKDQAPGVSTRNSTSQNSAKGDEIEAVPESKENVRDRSPKKTPAVANVKEEELAEQDEVISSGKVTVRVENGRASIATTAQKKEQEGNGEEIEQLKPVDVLSRDESTEAENEDGDPPFALTSAVEAEVREPGKEEYMKDLANLSKEEKARLEQLMAQQGTDPESFFDEKGDETSSSEEMNTANPLTEKADVDFEAAMLEEPVYDEETMDLVEQEIAPEEVEHEMQELQNEMDVPLEEILRQSGIDPSQYNIPAANGVADEVEATEDNEEGEEERPSRRRRRRRRIVRSEDPEDVHGSKEQGATEKSKTKENEEPPEERKHCEVPVDQDSPQLPKSASLEKEKAPTEKLALKVKEAPDDSDVEHQKTEGTSPLKAESATKVKEKEPGSISPTRLETEGRQEDPALLASDENKEDSGVKAQPAQQDSSKPEPMNVCSRVEESAEIEEHDEKLHPTTSMQSDIPDTPDSDQSGPIRDVEKPEETITSDPATGENDKNEIELFVAALEKGDGSTGQAAFVSPSLLRGNLRAYQADGVRWLITLYEKKLNGILADEMGLGKTIMTISLLAWLAEKRGVWGPHLVVVPTSVMLNWEVEFKKWCPGLKILTYFGSMKERKRKRQGWSKSNTFHICITSYKLVVQDASSFRRKKWKYLILDEAQHIKNFQSQRWQTLLHFSTKRRLLLTGTPLQNSVMELWSLMHFLMPDVFSSHSEFRDWFFNPINNAIEDQNSDENAVVVKRLHAVLRPFMLRRLKSDVEKGLPGKVEHIVRCALSKRQRLLYEDFMARGDTQETLNSGNFMGVMNVLMQLRKVCNHPDLFEGRPIVSPLEMPGLRYRMPNMIVNAIERPPLKRVDKSLLGLELLKLECDNHGGPWWERRLSQLCASEQLIASKEEIGDADNPAFELIDCDVNAMLFEAKYRRRVTIREAMLTRLRCSWKPIYGSDLIVSCTIQTPLAKAYENFEKKRWDGFVDGLLPLMPSLEDFGSRANNVTERFCTCVTPAISGSVGLEFSGMNNVSLTNDIHLTNFRTLAKPVINAFSSAFVRSKVALPDTRLVQWDCGKLQVLSGLLRDLKKDKHRCLIFTQMTKVLDILETFLNLHGHRYLRLDGNTKTEDRQKLTERFNMDDRIFCFILTTRAGGVGLNLTGADCVLFYDSDWNPQVDAQAQDRAHRIGQTRTVHIYRFISERTVEENILAKANQKRNLESIVIQQAGFNKDGYQKINLMELIQPIGQTAMGSSSQMKGINEEEIGAAMEADEDVIAEKERQLQVEDFGEETVLEREASSKKSLTYKEIEESLNPIQRYALSTFRTFSYFTVA